MARRQQARFRSPVGVQPGVATVPDVGLPLLLGSVGRAAKMAVVKLELAPVEMAAAAAVAELVAVVAVAVAVAAGLEAAKIIMVLQKCDKHSGPKLTGRALFRCACWACSLNNVWRICSS